MNDISGKNYCIKLAKSFNTPIKYDISSIEMFRKDDFIVLSEISNFDVKPKIVKYEGEYYVSCCYWTDWGGLKRELVVITINNGKATNIQFVDTTTIVEYDCGIMF